jgi:hypothetical protein
LQIIRATVKQRTDDGYMLAKIGNLSNMTFCKSEMCSGNVSVNKWQCIKYETNKFITVWDAAAQKWCFELSIRNIKSIFQDTT